MYVKLATINQSLKTEKYNYKAIFIIIHHLGIVKGNISFFSTFLYECV